MPDKLISANKPLKRVFRFIKFYFKLLFKPRVKQELQWTEGTVIVR